MYRYYCIKKRKDEEVERVIRYVCFGQNQLPRLRVIYIKKAKQERLKKKDEAPKKLSDECVMRRKNDTKRMGEEGVG